MKFFRFILALAVMANFLSARDLAPTYWIENVTATDDSVQTSLVFCTVAGVNYRVETSDNLTSWDEGDEFYGMGHEYVVAMRQFTPPPPPPPGGNPPPLPPARSTSLMLRPSSGTGGGTIVAWKSFDHGGAMTALLEEDLHEDWDMMPLFAQRYGNHYFFIWHPSVPAAPPAENAALGPLDSAMMAQLVTSLPAMNQQVADSVAAARNSPPPAPPAPGSKKFWRIRADWSGDSDRDGSPDWAEFEMMADPSHPDHNLADAFNGDADANGTNDGNQLDSDRDSIADSIDADLDDEAIDWQRGPSARYALFELSGMPDPTTFDGQAIHVTDGGHVLFPEGVWRNGSYNQLQLSGPGVDFASALAMDNDGMVVGRAFADLMGDDALESGPLVYWPDLSSAPTVVMKGQNNFAAPSYDLAYRLIDPSTVIGDERTVIAPEYEIATDEDGNESSEFLRNSIWRIPGGAGGAITSGDAPELATNHFTEDDMWGPDYEGGVGTRWYGEGGVQDFDGWYPTFARSPSGGYAAMGSSRGAMLASPGSDFNWMEAGNLAKAIDMSTYGWALLNNGRIWSNGFSVPLPVAAPGLSSPWDDRWVKLRDSSPKGNILLSRCGSGSYSPTEQALAVPIHLEDVENATGVDSVSVTSEYPGSEPANKQWIMAPAGGTNSVRIKSTASSSCSLALQATPATISPAAVTADGQILSVSAPAGASSADHDVRISLGGQDALSSPVGIKVMKRRTVNVRVWLVPCLDANGNSNSPDIKPTKQALDEYLTDKYLPQVNAVFNCQVTDTDVVNFDTADGSAFGAPANSFNPYNSILDTDGDGRAEFESLRNSYYDASANINVYIVGSAYILVRGWVSSINFLLTGRADGMAHLESRSALLASSSFSNQTLQQVLDTVAHEVGHLLVGAGHPDEAEKKNVNGVDVWSKGGIAPLPRTKHVLRMMCSGANRKTDGTSCQLVKTEWDKAEDWFRIEEAANRMNP